MCLELLVQVYFTFKRHRGLYFWSIVITTWGLLLQITGYLLKNFSYNAPKVLVTIICKVGWVSNVTGFSLVLYSRLHLVVHNHKVLRLVLTMIIVDAIIIHTPVEIFEFVLISSHRERYVHPMEIMERIQQTGFTCQESLIGALYIFHTTRFLNGGYAITTRKVMGLLIVVQSLVIGLDAGLTTFDYENMFTLKCTLHPFVYALKLKLEFVVLNQLLELVRGGMAPGNFLTPEDQSEQGSEKGQSPLTQPGKNADGTAKKSHFWSTFTPRDTSASGQEDVKPASTTDKSTSSGDTITGTANGIMKTDDVTVSSAAKDSIMAPDGVLRQDSDVTLQGGEDVVVMGNGNGQKLGREISHGEKRLVDIERQYLGRSFS
jgi:hypothetical protein